MDMVPKKGGIVLKAIRFLLYGVAYTLSFALAFIGGIGGRGHSHQLIGEPTIGVSTAHADAPPVACSSADSCSGGVGSCDACGCASGGGCGCGCDSSGGGDGGGGSG